MIQPRLDSPLKQLLSQSEPPLLQALLDALSAHVAIIDHTGTIVAVNQAWARFAQDNGSPAAQATGVGQNYFTVCQQTTGAAASTAQAVLSGMQGVLAGTQASFTLEYPCHAPTELRWFRVQVTPLASQPPCVVIAHENITLHRRVGDPVAYGVMHDLKGPLRRIAYLASWLSTDTASLPPAAQAHLRQLHERIERMERLLADLLAYSRPHPRGQPLEPVDMTALLQQLVAALDPPAGFTVVLAPGLPTFRTVRLPLETVLRNLLANAIQYHHQPSQGQVQIIAQVSGDWIEFTVQDDGPGLAAIDTNPNVGTGSGLGLVIVKQLIENQGGTLQVESAPGRGTCFRFTWPNRSPANSS